MSARSLIPRRARHMFLSDDEHRKWLDLGGSKWLYEAIPEAWEKLPQSVREQSDQRAADPFWRTK